MKIAILKCRDCGEVLNETEPFPDKEEGRVAVSSGLAAGPCPKGCRSTFSDLNMNTTLEVRSVDDESGKRLFRQASNIEPSVATQTPR